MRKEKKKWVARILVCVLLICSIFTIDGKAATLAEEAKQTVAFGKTNTVDIKKDEVITLKVVMKQKGTFDLDFKPLAIQGLNAQLYDGKNNLLGEYSKANSSTSVLSLKNFGRSSMNAGTYYLRLWTDSEEGIGNYTYFARQTAAQVASIELCISLKKGQSLQLGTIISNSKNKNVKWSTSNKNIATVSQTGKVVAKKKGTVTIKADNSSDLLAMIKIKVTESTNSSNKSNKNNGNNSKPSKNKIYAKIRIDGKDVYYYAPKVVNDAWKKGIGYFWIFEKEEKVCTWSINSDSHTIWVCDKNGKVLRTYKI